MPMATIQCSPPTCSTSLDFCKWLALKLVTLGLCPSRSGTSGDVPCISKCWCYSERDYFCHCGAPVGCFANSCHSCAVLRFLFPHWLSARYFRQYSLHPGVPRLPQQCLPPAMWTTCSLPCQLLPSFCRPSLLISALVKRPALYPNGKRSPSTTPLHTLSGITTLINYMLRAPPVIAGWKITCGQGKDRVKLPE